MSQQSRQTCFGVRSLSSLSRRVARHWWPHLLAVAFAAVVVSITIVGSLGVGDGIQQGLRRLASKRLGGIAAAVVGSEWFGLGLASGLEQKLHAASYPETVVPVATLSVTVSRPAGDGQNRTKSVAVLLGCDHPNELGFRISTPDIENGVGLSVALAKSLGVVVGDTVLLRASLGSAVPADLPLGRRSGRSITKRMQVSALLPLGSVGDFSLNPAEVTAGVVLVSLEVGQELIGKPARVNMALVVAAKDSRRPQGQKMPLQQDLEQMLTPTLDDLGLVVTHEPQRATRLSSHRLLLEPAVDNAARRVLAPHGGTPSLVFLANNIRPAAAEATIGVPYSTVLGVEDTKHPLGELLDSYGRPLRMPTDNDVIINQWLADDLAAQGHPVSVGDELKVICFAPETFHGQVDEKNFLCRVSGIAAMQELAVDRDVVPDVSGVTDEASIADWDPPFPFDRTRIRERPPHDEDEQYWQEYGAAPKIFMPLVRARKIAGSRFGRTTAWHLPPQTAVKWQSLSKELEALIPPAEVGLRVLPLATSAALAATGSTPFGLLFLALSSFVIAAGLILLWLLFSLLVTARIHTLGVLAAVGWSPSRLAALLGLVATTTVLGGVILGVALGPFWSQILVLQLGAAWTTHIDDDTAIVFGHMWPTLTTLSVGGAAAAIVAVVAVFAAAFRAGQLPPMQLLRGVTAAKLFLWPRPARPLTTLTGLASRELRRCPSRSVAVVALVALAEFLVVFVSGFELTLPEGVASRTSPTGGWTYLLRFATPTSVDPTRPAMSGELGLTTRQRELLHSCELSLIRSSQGDDASCTNLFSTSTPIVWGLSEQFLKRGGFEFAGHIPLPAGMNSPWFLLNLDTDEDEPIPVVLDAATAKWALKLGGVGSQFRLDNTSGSILPSDADTGIACQIVGLLQPGILQGAILMAEKDFTRLFPLVSGYQQALLDVPDMASEPVSGNGPKGAVSVNAAITAAWADSGVVAEPTAIRLRRLYAVQNTFLAGFQTLGTLGLMLGTFGLTAVMIQGIVERRELLAVLRAIGFTRYRLSCLLWQETLLQVLVGLFIGAGGGLLASLPFAVSGRLGMPWAWVVVSMGGTLLVATLTGFLTVWGVPIAQRPSEQ